MGRWSAFVGMSVLAGLGLVISMTTAGEKVKGDKSIPVFQEEGKKEQGKRGFQPGERGRGFQPGQRGRGGFGGFQMGQVMPSFLAERLNLTEEQKKQIEVLQTEVTAKIDKILTAEQKKQLEEIRANPFGGRRGGPEGGREGGRRGGPEGGRRGGPGGECPGRPSGEGDNNRPARPEIN